MKLCVFARNLSRRPTGRGYLARELVTSLLKSSPSPSIDLFCSEDPGIPGARVHSARGSGILSDLWRVSRGIASDVVAIRPDVFWGTTHFLPRGLPSSLPKVVTLLDLVWKDHPETLSLKNRWGASWLERGLREATQIACISQFTRDRLEAHFPELAGRAGVVPLSPNPRLAAMAGGADLLRERFGLESPYILNVDTFEPRKNLRLALEAMSRLRQVTFVQCGHPGWNVQKDLNLARSMPNVRLLDYVDEAALAALYRGARACIFPSIYEGFHLPPLDALSLGAPVLASDIPVHREVLGDAAEYFPPSDAGRLEALIDACVRDDAFRLKLAEKGRSRAAAFSWDAAAARMASMFEAAR